MTNDALLLFGLVICALMALAYVFAPEIEDDERKDDIGL